MPDRPVSPHGSAPAKSYLKIVLIAGGLLVVVAVLLFTVAWRSTGGPADAADRFLTTLARQGPAAAWDSGSPAFRQAAPEADWEAFARRAGLTDYKSSHWTSREIENSFGRVQGSITTGNGATLPLTIDLVHAGDAWLVQKVHLSQAGFSQAPAGLTARPGTPTPAGAGTVSAAAIANGCKARLAEQAHVTLDSVACPADLAAAPGASTRCTVRNGALRAGMTVRIESIDRQTQRANFDCRIDDHPL